jgi:hypothetical protein
MHYLNKNISRILKTTVLLFLFTVIAFFGGVQNAKALPDVSGPFLVLTASPNPANQNVTITAEATLSQSLNNCDGAHYYEPLGTSVAPTNTLQIVSGGQFAGQTIPVVKTVTEVYPRCMGTGGIVTPASVPAKYVGSKQFSTASLANGTYTVYVKVTDDYDETNTRPVSFIVDHGNPPTVNLSASPTSVSSGGSSTLSWSTSGSPTSCTASGGWSGSKSVSGGSQAISNITGNTTYTITCSNSAGSDGDSATVTVSGGTAPTVILSADPTSIDSGGSSTLTWTTSGSPTSCTASGGWSGPKSASGGTQSQSVSPVDDTNYTIECSNANGSSSDSASVTVNQVQTPNPQNPIGVHESASNSTCRIAGWMNDPDTPTVSPTGYVYADGVEILTGSSGPCASGQCPFNVDISSLITPNVSHSILIKVADTTTGQTFNLSNSPKNIMCSSGSGSGSIAVDLTARVSGSGTYQDSLSVPSGSNIDLRWTTSGSPTSCTASGAWSGTKSTAGGVEPKSNITSNKTYTIECTKGAETTTDSLVVSVSATNAPTVNLQTRQSPADPWGEGPVTVQSGDTGALRWTVSNATSCIASASPSDSLWTGAKNSSGGSQNLANRTTSKTYGISCTGPGGTRADSEQINVGTTPTGTINVTSINVDTGAPVLTSWNLTGPSSQTESNASSESYPNMPLGTYTLVPLNAPAGYELVRVTIGGGETSSQSLDPDGDIKNFTIEYRETGGGGGGGNPIDCTPDSQATDTGETVSVNVSGGGNLYYWTTNADASPSEEQSGNFSSFTTVYSTPGSKTVTVSDGLNSVQCTIEVAQAAVAVCSNGLDDDGDGFADYPADLDCSGPNGSSEAGTASDYELDSGGLIIMGAGSTRSGATNISVRAQGRFLTNVDFSPARVSGLPSRTTAFFSDGNGSPNEKGDLTVNSSEYASGVQFYVETANPLAIGEYPLVVTSDASGIVRTENILLRVVNVGTGGSGTTTPIFEEF